MPPPPLISVALCTCNGAPYFATQLASVLAQSHPAIEIVVVDDASTDGTVAIAEDFARRDPRIRLHRNPQRIGLNANFLSAFGHCRGEYIAPCDQDDVWAPRKLEHLLARLGGHDLGYCDSNFVDADGRHQGRTVSATRSMIAGRGHLRLAFDNSVSGHAMLFRRDLLDHALPMPDGVFYDWWLAFAASQRAGIVYLDQALVDFRRHAGAQTRMGNASDGSRRRQRGSDARAWLETVQRLLEAAAARPWPCAEAAGEIALALAATRQGRAGAALWRTLLRHRGALEPLAGSPVLGAIRLRARIQRRLARQRRAATGGSEPQ